MPKVSIIITSYNHRNFVAKAIQSFLDQTFQDFEMIIVDDCSTDNSKEIIKSFNDVRIKTIFLEKNLGFCRATNIAIQEASGDYIKMFASDDVARNDLLAKQVEFLEKNTQYGGLFSMVDVIDDKGEISKRKTRIYNKYFLNVKYSRAEFLNHFFCKGNFLAAPTAIIKKEALLKVGGFDERIIQGHDFDLWLRLCLYGCNLYVLPESLVYYRQLDGYQNMSSNTENVRKRLVFDNERILERFFEIKDVALFREIFFESSFAKNNITPDLIPFFLAQEALKINSIHHKQFAITALFRILGDRKIAKILEDEFGFSVNKDFAKIVTDNPLGVLNIILNKKPFYKVAFKKVKNKVRSLFKL